MDANGNIDFSQQMRTAQNHAKKHRIEHPMSLQRNPMYWVHRAERQCAESVNGGKGSTSPFKGEWEQGVHSYIFYLEFDAYMSAGAP